MLNYYDVLILQTITTPNFIKDDVGVVLDSIHVDHELVFDEYNYIVCTFQMPRGRDDMQVNVAGLRRNIKNLAHNYSDAQVCIGTNIIMLILTKLRGISSSKFRVRLPGADVQTEIIEKNHSKEL